MLDAFGPKVQFYYKNNKTYKSRVGTIATLLTVLAFFIYLSLQTSKLVSGKDPFQSMMTEPNDDALIELYRHNFFFAIEKLDPRVGRLRVQ